jgi:hypothetical protein
MSKHTRKSMIMTDRGNGGGKADKTIVPHATEAMKFAWARRTVS